MILEKIRVENVRKVADYLGLDSEKISDEYNGRDLMKTPEANDFIEKYKKYFTTMDKNLLREFYEKTGLILMNRIATPDNKYRHHCLTMYGYMCDNDCKKYDDCHNFVRNNHLTSEIRLDSPLEIDGEDYYEHDYDKDEVWGFSNEELEALHKDSKLILADEFEHCYKTGPRKNLVGNFGEKFELKNGELFRDGRKIEEDVKTLFRLNDCNTYIIFEDNRIENLEYHATECERNLKHKKILYGTYFLAVLRDNKELEITLISRADEAESYALDFCNIDDVEFTPSKDSYKNEDGTLKIKTGKNIIEFPIYEYQPFVRNYCR